MPRKIAAVLLLVCTTALLLGALDSQREKRTGQALFALAFAVGMFVVAVATWGLL